MENKCLNKHFNNLMVWIYVERIFLIKYFRAETLPGYGEKIVGMEFILKHT